jgi:hypothetical protein
MEIDSGEQNEKEKGIQQLVSGISRYFAPGLAHFLTPDRRILFVVDLSILRTILPSSRLERLLMYFSEGKLSKIPKCYPSLISFIVSFFVILDLRKSAKLLLVRRMQSIAKCWTIWLPIFSRLFTSPNGLDRSFSSPFSVDTW